MIAGFSSTAAAASSFGSFCVFLFANNYLEIHMPTGRRLNHSAKRYGNS